MHNLSLYVGKDTLQKILDVQHRFLSLAKLAEEYCCELPVRPSVWR